jgi:UPF0148 protein
MAAKKEDEIMAEYLLKGGKMLEKTCKVCGCPMFEYRKKTFCVVCAERELEQGSMDAPQTGTKTRSPPKPTGTGMVQESSGAPVPAGTAALADELATTVYKLCVRIRVEEDPDRCLTMMNAVKIGIEALQILRQL